MAFPAPIKVRPDYFSIRTLIIARIRSILQVYKDYLGKVLTFTPTHIFGAQVA